MSTVMRSTLGGEAGALAVSGSGARLQAVDMPSDIMRAKASVFGDISQKPIRPAVSGHGVSRDRGRDHSRCGSVDVEHVVHLMGHGSSRMVRPVYAHLDDATFERAVASLPPSLVALEAN